MAISEGKVEYRISDKPVIALGVSHTNDEMLHALIGEVYDKVYDVVGNTELIKSILTGLSDTGFTREALLPAFAKSNSIRDWEIGEAYAYVYLENHCSSVIPWSLSRDIKKPGSSLPGADIVGIYLQGESTCFLFGEIKTSSDQDSPPSLMYGQTGLKKQLDDLCKENDIILALVKYLGFRLRNTEHWKLYINACANYFSNYNNVHITGVLIRDVSPNQNDVAARVDSLCPYCANGRQIDLLAVYLPEKSISTFVSILESEHERRIVTKC